MFSKDFVTKILFRKILYLGDKLCVIGPDFATGELSNGKAGTFAPIIISKKYYFETSKTFPFESTKDIQSAVKTDIASLSPFTSSRFLTRKVSTAKEGTTVNLWFFDAKTSEILQNFSPLLIIPETALLAFPEPGAPRIYCIKREEGTVYVHTTSDGLVRSVASKQNGIDLQKFRRIIGFAARDCEALAVEDKDYFPLFFQVLRNLSLKTLFDFLNPDAFKHVIRDKRFKITVGVASALFLVYMALAASTPYFAEKWLRQQNSKLTQDLAGLLDKKALIDSLSAKQRLLADKVNTYTYKLPILNVLNDVLPEQTTIRQLNLSGNVVEMRGSTPKASDLLAALSQTKGIKNAQFTSPLVEEGKSKLETFTLTYTYAHE